MDQAYSDLRIIAFGKLPHFPNRLQIASGAHQNPSQLELHIHAIALAGVRYSPFHTLVPIWALHVQVVILDASVEAHREGPQSRRIQVIYFLPEQNSVRG